MRLRPALAFALLAAALALVAAACGGGGGKKSSDAAAGAGSVPAGADYVVSSALGFLAANTDFDGDQWQTLDDLSAKFRDRDELLDRIRAELTKQGVSWDEIEAALGPETDAAFLDSDNGLFLTQSSDTVAVQRIGRKLLGEDEESWVSSKIGDWLAASDKQSSVDTAKRAHAGSSLADGAAFQEAMRGLPADALARVWVAGKALSEITKQAVVSTGSATPIPRLGTPSWLAAALEAKDDGLRLSFSSKSTTPSESGAPYASELVDEVPSGVLAYASFRDLARPLREAARAFPEIVAKVEEALGVTLEELAPLFEGEGAIYARQGTPLPEVTIVLQVQDEAAARATADRLVPKLAASLGATGAPTTTVVDGVTLKLVRAEAFPVVWGVFDGKLVISDSTGAIDGLKGGDKLKDDSTFAEARESAEMPDETNGFLYLNLKDIVPLIRNLAGASPDEIPEEVLANLDPLRSLLLYAVTEGNTSRGAGFLALD